MSSWYVAGTPGGSEPEDDEVFADDSVELDEEATESPVVVTWS
jgi:hypothetical protein